jgi:hypothetical protein
VLDGNSGSLDDWSRYTVPQLHAQLSAVTEDQLTRDWDQVSALQRTYELLSDHGARLKVYRDELVAKWPLEENPAAAAYVASLDQLTSSIQTTADAAARNHAALSGVIGSIVIAKSQVKKIHDEYVANESAMARYQQKVDDFIAVAGQSDAPVGIDPGPPPVQNGRQQQLHVDAMVELGKISSTAADANRQIVIPPDYVPPRDPRADSNRHLEDGAAPDSGPAAPAIVPPAHSAFAPGGHGYSPPAPGAGVPSASGPTLTGGGPITGAPPVGSPSPQPTPLPPPGMPGPGGWEVPPVLGGGRPTDMGGARPQFAGAGRLPVPGTPGRSPAPRGVIGGVPTEPGAPIRRINPIGGVIGQPGTEGPGMVATGGAASNRTAAGGVRGGTAGGRASGMIGEGGVIGSGSGTGRGGSSVRSGMGIAQRAGSAPDGASILSGRHGSDGNGDGRRRRSSEDRPGWDPDNPFAIGHGVDPVLRAADEPTSHDPGPGVIGIDR